VFDTRDLIPVRVASIIGETDRGREQQTDQPSETGGVITPQREHTVPSAAADFIAEQTKGMTEDERAAWIRNLLHGFVAAEGSDALARSLGPWLEELSAEGGHSAEALRDAAEEFRQEFKMTRGQGQN
jgi:hypothetical protein